MREGTRVEIAQLLRQLYAGKGPASSADGSAIRTLEDIILGEISIVLDIPRSALESEMRERHTVFSGKKRSRS